MSNYTVRFRNTASHPSQHKFINSEAKRKIIRAGRRGGKTTGVAQLALKYFLAGLRPIYATPTQDQIDAFWFEITRALAGPIEAGVYYKNETRHLVELPGTKQRIRAKTAWNADTLRGDYADLLILDEFQLMHESTWQEVGAPMLADNNGDAVFIYTPPSRRSRSATKADDPRHASKMYKRAEADDSGRWEAFYFTSLENPFISQEAISELSDDMTALSYRQEFLAIDEDEMPGALWNRKLIDDTRIPIAQRPEMTRIVIAVDPPGGATECGIVACGRDKMRHGYALEDGSLKGSPAVWGQKVVDLYDAWEADAIVAETNYGGDMVKNVIDGVRPGLPFKKVHASRGKLVRAEPVAARFENGLGHIVGQMAELEDELVSYDPEISTKSPNRLDAMVWGFFDLVISSRTSRNLKVKGL